jgi:formyl-CoA transferase
MSLPLGRFSVVDLTRARSGPTAVRQLADMGARVIKVESREDRDGDFSRHGFDFQNVHRNKRSMTLDLKKREGVEILKKLVAKSDGFGQSGPYRDRPGYDQIAQGMGGLMSVTGLPGQGPVRVGIPVADLTAGIFLAQGILVALLEREVSGKGQWVHTSLLEAMVTMLDFQTTRWLMAGEIPPQAGNDHPTGIPTGVFKTSDGHINIAASGQKMYRRLCETIGREELIEDPRFNDQNARSKNRQAMNEELDKTLSLKPSAHWVELLNTQGVPCGPILNVKQVFANEQVQHLGLAVPVKSPKLGDIKLQRVAPTLSRTPGSVRTATPEMGEHTDQILGELGYSATDIKRLHDQEVV